MILKKWSTYALCLTVSILSYLPLFNVTDWISRDTSVCLIPLVCSSSKIILLLTLDFSRLCKLSVLQMLNLWCWIWHYSGLSILGKSQTCWSDKFSNTIGNRETTRPTTWPSNNPGEKPYYLPTGTRSIISSWLVFTVTYLFFLVLSIRSWSCREIKNFGAQMVQFMSFNDRSHPAHDCA